MRDVFEKYIPDNDELEAFGAWAFGHYYREFDERINFMEAWNHLHSNLLKLEPNGAISVDVPKMVKIWKNK